MTNGAAMKPRTSCEQDTWLSRSTCAGIEIASRDPLCNYSGVLAPREPCPSLSLIALSGAFYTGSKSSESFF